MAYNILIIGSGITGALCVAGLKKLLPKASVQLWEKARGAGGRMTTWRTEDGNFADIGAQYITVNQASSADYKTLITNGIIEPLTGHIEGSRSFPEGTQHYVAPSGMSAIVKFYLNQNSQDTLFNARVNAIERDGAKYKVSTEQGHSETFDLVISTMPVPQFLALSNVDSLLPTETVSLLKGIEYSTRFVLVWYYTKPVAFSSNWVAKYVYDDDIFRYVAWDNARRNRSYENASVIFHTSTEFGKANKMRSKEEVEGELVARARKLFSDWPAPQATRCHKWLYSQVVDAKCDKGIIVGSQPTLILAGDAFTNSNVTGCIASARFAVENAYKSLTSESVEGFWEF